MVQDAPVQTDGTCRWCRGPITNRRRRTFCSENCVHQYRIRSSATCGIVIIAHDQDTCATCCLHGTRACAVGAASTQRSWRGTCEPLWDQYGALLNGCRSNRTDVDVSMLISTDDCSAGSTLMTRTGTNGNGVEDCGTQITSWRS